MDGLADLAATACLVCAQIGGDVDVLGGIIEHGPVAVFHRPPSGDALPYAGHLLVCPKRHAGDFAAVNVAEAAAVGTVMSGATRALKELGAARVYVATIGHTTSTTCTCTSCPGGPKRRKTSAGTR